MNGKTKTLNFFRSLNDPRRKTRAGSTSVEGFCILGNFLCLLIVFKINFLKKNLSGIPSECQIVWTLIRSTSLRPDLGPNCLPKLSADDTGRQRVKQRNYSFIFRSFKFSYSSFLFLLFFY